MEELTHKVEFRRTKQQHDVGWHVIAAFDCEQAAERYAKDCQEFAAPNTEYKVSAIG